MKRCPKCNNDFPDDANFCPVDAGHLVAIEGSADGTPVDVPQVDTGGHELLDGRFALGDIIGGHRTGPVYQARDKQGSSAIIKLVNAAVFPSTLLKQRTERELKQLEHLDHPGVAKVLGHGRREDDLWIATERVDGVPLSQYIAEHGAQSQAASIAILAQIGGALEAAAKLGVTHRDLAPKNVLITLEQTIKLINFGVPTPGPAERSQVEGVPEYVAPEQIEGRPVDQRSNIYSLGAIGYALLTGSPPFSGSPEEVYAAHNGTDVRPLGASDGVSAELSAVLLKSVEKASSKRFMTLRQFLGDLSNVQDAAGVGDASQTPAAIQRSLDANKTLMGVAAVSLEGMMAGRQPALGTPAPSDSAAETSVHRQSVATADPTSNATPFSDVALAPTAVDQDAFNTVQDQPANVAAAAPVPAALEPRAPAVSSAPSGKKKGSAAKAAQAPAANKGKFRETMWFKKGELDEAAAAAAATSKPEDRVSDKVDLMEMDVRYNDDGTITKQDQERLSLRTGATMMMEAVPTHNVASHQVSERDLVSEMTGGRNKILAGLGILAVVIAIVLAIVLS